MAWCVGPLAIVNSSMTTVSVFANLESVASNGQTTTFTGHKYEVVVSGTYEESTIARYMCHLALGNALLSDIGSLLTIQDSGDRGTYVANNAILCFGAAVSWSQRPQSYLEYDLDQVCNKL